MGAIMAAGILDAGGRNATVGLRSRAGHFRWAGNDGVLAVLRAGAGQPRSGRRAAAGTAGLCSQAVVNRAPLKAVHACRAGVLASMHGEQSSCVMHTHCIA